MTSKGTQAAIDKLPFKADGSAGVIVESDEVKAARAAGLYRYADALKREEKKKCSSRDEK